jgi:hypothetical protein
MSDKHLLIDIFPSPHPLWSTILEKPPEGVRYLIRRGLSGRAYLAFSSLIGDRKLIHFCNGIKLAPRRRWVADMESVKVLFKDYRSMFNNDARNDAQNRIETGECRYILPLTEAAKKTLTRFLRLKGFQVRVLYPTFYTNLKPKHEGPRDLILFIGGSYFDKSFEAKGGREVSIAWMNIHRDFKNYKFFMLSTPPPSLAEKLRGMGVEIGPMPREKLLTELYPRARVILLPSMMDTVGYSVIEAMNFGIPPIVSDHFAMPELVGDAGIILRTPTGLWLNDGTPNISFHQQLDNGPFSELSERIADALHRLLSDDGEWVKLSERALARMNNPPFHISYRNKVLHEVYEDASSENA